MTEDGLVLQRLAQPHDRAAYALVPTRDPLDPSLVDVYFLDVRDLHRLRGHLGLAAEHGLTPPRVVAFGPGQHLRSAFLAGCADYLKEPWDRVEMEARLERVATAGGGEGGARFVVEGRELRLPDGRAVRLSAHEAVVAGLLFANRGVIVSRRALAYALWGRLPADRSRAVDMHVSALRRKVGRDVISCVRGQGYVVSVIDL